MTTLIVVGNSQGEVRRCDAHCYNAREPECVCICGGRNHGVGFQQAIQNTAELAEQWFDQADPSGELKERMRLMSANVIQFPPQQPLLDIA